MMKTSCFPRLYGLLISTSCFLGLTIMTGCTPDASQYRFHRENVQGPVKQIVQRTYGAVKDSAGWQEGRLRQKRVLEYDREGRLTKMKVYGADTSLTERFDYQIESNRRIEVKRYNQNNKLTHLTSYSYPWLYGSVESESRTSGDSLRWYSTYTFDQNLRETKQNIYGPEDRLNYRIQYRYNPDGFIMEKTGVEEFFYTFKKYDEEQNWTRRLNEKAGRITTLTTRTLTYYE